MTMLQWSLLAALACLVMALLLWLTRRETAVDSERRSRPRELAHARLVYMERLFRIRYPIRLTAKLDRAYQQPDGLLVLVELKTRRNDSPYLTDIIQLSAQKLAVEVQTGQRVAPHAFVTTERPDGRRSPGSHRVELLDAAQVVGLSLRREAIISGREKAAYAANVGACDGCSYRMVCDRFS